jgi:tetratricopeptide (TPR) repeat protein
MTSVPVKPIHELLQEGKEQEALMNFDKAIQLYNQTIKIDPLNEIGYSRLMTLFRKQKLYKNEYDLIKEGIKTFENFYNSKKSQSKKVSEVSEKLSKSLGLTDKKGNKLYEPEPLGRWKRRLLMVEKKLEPVQLNPKVKGKVKRKKDDA